MEHNETQKLDSKIVWAAALVAVILIALLLGKAPNLPQAEENADTYAEQAWEIMASNFYNITDARDLYEQALNTDPRHEKALYSLARIYYITRDYEKSLATIAEYKDAYPNNERIYYISGLANAYAGNLDTAEKEFLSFVESGLSTWPGHLDLAWVYFQKDNFTQARDVLETARETFGSNAWIDTSLGAVYIALGEREEAEPILREAAVHAESITSEDWSKHYSFNNPANAEEEIQQLKDVIAFNLGLATGSGSEVSVAEVASVSFTGYSNKGIGKGFVVSACGDSCSTISCISASNVCGAYNTGTQNTCGGSCSATVPANPSGSCEVATSCGVAATGYTGCGGVCHITQYPFCTTVENPNGGDDIEWVTVGDGLPGDPVTGPTEISCQVFTVPTLVSLGSSSVVRWVSGGAASAEITGTNGDNWSGIAGEELTSVITTPTTYTLTCTGYDDSVVTDTAIVHIVPDWQEF